MHILAASRVEDYLERFPGLSAIVARLDAASIPYMIGGSGCLFLFGNERAPDDVDIYLPDGRHDAADRLFGVTSFLYTSPLERVRNSNPDGSHTYQLTSGLRIEAEGTVYALSMGPDVFAHSIAAGPLRLLPPEDVLLIKALLRRGPEVGKHDLADIQAFLRVYPHLDRGYLEARIEALGASARIGGAFLGA